MNGLLIAGGYRLSYGVAARATLAYYRFDRFMADRWLPKHQFYGKLVTTAAATPHTLFRRVVMVGRFAMKPSTQTTTYELLIPLQSKYELNIRFFKMTLVLIVGHLAELLLGYI